MLTRFTVRNITINNAQTAVFSHWNWGMAPHYYYDWVEVLTKSAGWTFQDIKINNCQVRRRRPSSCVF